jgi:hypothetical protein
VDWFRSGNYFLSVSMYAAISSAAERLKAICGILGCGSSKKYASLLGSKFEDDEVWIAGKPGEPETAETKAFPQRPLAQSEIDRHVKESAGRETATERPQPRNDHPDNRNLDVWSGLAWSRTRTSRPRRLASLTQART